MLKDKDIREPLFDFLEENWGKVRILEEKNMGRSRADILMVTEDALVGLEIKSDADTYVRLAGQVKDYDSFCDYNYVVAGTSHAMHIREHVPPYWGVITVERVTGPAGELLDFYVLRKAEKNPKKKLEKKLSLLWKSELLHIQQELGLPKYAGKSRKYVIARMKEKLPEIIIEGKLQRLISEELFQRDYTGLE